MEYTVHKVTVELNCDACGIVIYFVETKQICHIGIPPRPAKCINISIFFVYLFKFVSFYSLWCQFLHTHDIFVSLWLSLAFCLFADKKNSKRFAWEKMEKFFAFVELNELIVCIGFITHFQNIFAK